MDFFDSPKRINKLKSFTKSLVLIIMVITILLQIFAYNPLHHFLLISGILFLLTVMIALDGILKEKRHLRTCMIWYALWLLNLTTYLFIEFY